MMVVNIGIVLVTVGLLGSVCAHDHEQQPNSDIFTNIQDTVFGDKGGLNNVFDWVFGDMTDEEHNKHEFDEHFQYLRGASDTGDLSEMIKLAGIKPEFLNFKAHDYDNNDKIDGLEMLAMILNEKVSNSKQNLASEQKVQLISKIIDQLFREEDVNSDGYLDFMEYSNARRQIETKIR